ncbi:hypothetical protein, partial [Pseudomonas aeruginosa]|uniref:hypothetical protein n=1 Tax=Pseudomonas aeruginosa TaxID=287 RepID=UPI000EDB1569|nr:hypothetical protein [Pseudomonas aeruginosa]
MTPVLWRLLRTYRWRLAAAMGLQALAGLCSLLPWMLLAWLAEPLARDLPPVDHVVESADVFRA